MPNKPKVILQLEKDLGLELEQVELVKLGEIKKYEFKKRAEFALNEQGEVVGLRLTRCKIEDLSPLQGLTTLTELNLSFNQITNLSPLQGLTALIRLDLIDNPIKDLSPLEGLVALARLSLNYNKIKDISPLQSLSTLAVLDLSSNKITDLSPLQGLTALTELNLSSNKITDPSPLQGLTALTKLNLGGNQISDLSPLQGLTALTGLNLDFNKINEVSPLQGLTVLTGLDLSHNQIQEITLDFLNHFPELTELKLGGNPIKNIPRIIFNYFDKNFLTPVRHYLEDLEKQQIQTYQTRVVLIGNGRVGKTCLLKRWLDNTFDEKEPSTHAAQLRRYSLKELAKEKQFEAIQLHIWDFGGQDIYHATHHLFMQTRAIFVLVWDAQTEKEPEQIEGGNSYRNYPLNYWLDRAKKLGDNSPILIVQTKKQRDGEKIPKDLAKLRHNYNIIASIVVDSSQDEGNGFAAFESHLIEQVKKSIETTCVTLPKSWWQVQSQLQEWQTSKKTIPMAEFEELCQKFGLDHEHIPSLLSYLDSVDCVFYEESSFEDQLILDRGWIINEILKREMVANELLMDYLNN